MAAPFWGLRCPRLKISPSLMYYRNSHRWLQWSAPHAALERPILDDQPGDPPKLSRVVGHQRQAEAAGVGGDEGESRGQTGRTQKRKAPKDLPMRGLRRLTLHYHTQNAVDARLVALAMTLEPIEHILIQTNRQLLFRWRPGHRRLFEKRLVQPRNVRIINLSVLHAVNPRQVALDRFFSHAGSPFSWK